MLLNQTAVIPKYGTFIHTIVREISMTEKITNSIEIITTIEAYLLSYVKRSEH